MKKYLVLDEHGDGTYKQFQGKVHEQIPLLLSEDREIMDASQLMRKRLEYRGFENEEGLEYSRKLHVGRAWIADTSLSTEDTAWYNPQKSTVKIVLNDPYLRNANKDIPTDKFGRFHVSTDLYDEAEGVEFTRDELNKLGLEKKVELSKKQAMNFPIWQLLARGKDLATEYLEFVFEQVGQRRFAAGFHPLPRPQGSRMPTLFISEDQCYMVPLSIRPMPYTINSGGCSGISGSEEYEYDFVGIASNKRED